MSTNQKAVCLQMPKPQKRDNEYYEQQLKDRFPAIHAEYLAGRFGSLREALIAAGIRKQRTRLLELKNSWAKATIAEKRAFIQWLGNRTANLSPASSAPTGASQPLTINRRLQPWAVKKINDVMIRRNLKSGDLSSELGLSRNDTCVVTAMQAGNQLQPHVVAALEQWLAAH